MVENLPISRTANDGISFFRCILMYLIVVHHTICHTSHANDIALFPAFLLTVPAVDGFLSISGLFGIKFSWRKCGVIAGQILFYAAVSSGFSIVAASFGWIEKPIIAVGNAWYGVAYLALMMVCPILNAGIQTLVDAGRARWMTLVLAVLLFGDFLSRAVGLGFSVAGFGSHTFATFFLVYCLMRLCVLSGMIWSRRFMYSGVIAALIYGCAFLSVRLLGHQTNCVDVLGKWGFYNSPLVVMIAMAVVAFFSRIKVPRILSGLATFIGPSMFAVYLIHDASPLGKLLVGFAGRFGTCGALGWSVVVFVTCVLLDLIMRRLPLNLLWKMRRF